ncbi:MAG: 16S rRNA (adenine(1518)-N(6)/adenine(1519)-N(6))-dimethyltransferase RsmA [Candidatus Odinarchaeia archaeon]
MFKNKDFILEKTIRSLKTNEIKLIKKLGQSFIVDPLYIKKQIEYANLNSEDTVLEIGGGIGNLTEFIAPLVKKVILIEIDKRFKNILEERLSAYSNIELIFDDALKIDYPPFNKIISNIPYYISSDITFKILEYKFEVGILMYQFEFAKRMCAEVGKKDYGRLTVKTRLKANTQLLEKVPKTAFFPLPEVDSAIIKIVPRREPIIESEYHIFNRIVDGLFVYKNKKVRKATLHFLEKIKITGDIKKKILSELPYSQYRVRDLNIEMIDNIAKYISTFKVI